MCAIRSEVSVVIRGVASGVISGVVGGVVKMYS